ncbi:hypothetical protein HHK36_031612 [Tetracentron sinense]|uniref:Uncharacterized protein n=1 Tax=Tetracentron sinense TaxID=13715 RepID=A0A834YC77_TETSI|nr:hypothetical protein HHK36_031612 [Tetracentron sinense]
MHKKVVSQSEEVKANTQETEENKVIKPRPRTFAKNSPWLRRRPQITSVDTNQPGDIVIMSSTKFDLPDDGTRWWENVLVGKEGERGTSCSIVGSGEELFTGLWVEEMEATTKGGDTFMEEGKSDWDDFCFDVNLWS